jgi:hypothetical protein
MKTTDKMKISAEKRGNYMWEDNYSSLAVGVGLFINFI